MLHLQSGVALKVNSIRYTDIKMTNYYSTLSALYFYPKYFFFLNFEGPLLLVYISYPLDDMIIILSLEMTWLASRNSKKNFNKLTAR